MLGVSRGLLKVAGQIAKRLDSMPEDTIYLVKNVETQVEAVSQKVSEFTDFMKTAETVIKAGEGEEFVTFEKPVFNYNKNRDISNIMERNKTVQETKPLDPAELVRREAVATALNSKDFLFIPQFQDHSDRKYGGHHVEVSGPGSDAVGDLLPTTKSTSTDSRHKSTTIKNLEEHSKLIQGTTKDHKNSQKDGDKAEKHDYSKQDLNADDKNHERAKQKYDFESYRKRKESDFSQVVEKKVPSNSFSRAFEFTKVGSSIMTSAVGSLVKNTFVGESSKSFRDFALTEANAEKLAQALCKMRGAALKLGQAMSMQEDQFLPEPIKKAFNKARQSANIMPQWQLEKIVIDAYGSNWLEDNFESFDMRPFAAASIGQVHKAVLKNGQRVVLKIQYPGVSNSIDSDLDNLKRLMTYTGIFPKTMFLDDFIDNTRVELKEECDYTKEAQKQTL